MKSLLRKLVPAYALVFVAATANAQNIDGEVEFYWNVLFDDEGNFDAYQFNHHSISIPLSVDIPFRESIGVFSQYRDGTPRNWSDVFIWDNPALAASHTINIATFVVNAAHANPAVLGQVDEVYNILTGAGPTEMNVNLPIHFTSPDAANWSLDLGVNAVVQWDVTLDSGSNINLNQTAVLKTLSIDSGAVFTIGNQLTVEETFQNFGNTTLSGSLNLSTPFHNHGTFRWNGGTFNASGPIQNHDTFILSGGSLTSSRQLVNSLQFLFEEGTIEGDLALSHNPGATFTILDGGTKRISSTLTNSMLIRQITDENIELNRGPMPNELINETGGIWEISGDGGVVSYGSGTTPSFINRGLFRKSAGDGESDFNNITFVNEGGTIQVDSGTLAVNRSTARFDWHGGQVVLSNGSILSPGVVRLYDDLPVNGNGTVVVYEIIEDKAGGGPAQILLSPQSRLEIFRGGHANFAYPNLRSNSQGIQISGAVDWTGGTISRGDTGNPIEAITGQWTISGDYSKAFSGSGADPVFINHADVTHGGDGDMLFASAHVINEVGATWNLINDIRFARYNQFSSANQFINRGLFRKSAGDGESDFNNITFVNEGGTIQVDSGTLSFQTLSIDGGMLSINEVSTLNADQLSISAGFDLALELDRLGSYGVISTLSSLDVAEVDLTIKLSGDAVVNPGDAFTFLTASSVSGTFDTVQNVTAPGGGDLFLVHYEADSVWLEALSSYRSVTGDLTGDGYVGAEDLDLLLANWGDIVTPYAYLAGDWTGDGIVGQADLQAVLDNWGNGSAPGGNVPEPASAFLLALAGFLLHHRRRVDSY